MRIPFEGAIVPVAAKSPFHCLFDLFLERLFYNDLISSSEEEQLTVGNILAILSFPGMFLALHLIPKYVFTPPDELHLAILGDKCLFLSLTMVILALLSVIQWDSLFPDRRDFTVLNVLPVKLQTLFAAKAASLGALMLIFVAVLNVASLVAFPIAAGEQHNSVTGLARFGLAHAVSIVGACLFVALSFVALRGVLMTLLPYRLFQRISPWVQLVCLFALFSVLLLLPALVGIVEPGSEQGMAYARFHPAMWFVGVSEWLEGHASREFQALAGIALRAFLLVAGLAVGSYLISYRTHVRKSLESLEPGSSRAAFQALLGKPIDTLLADRPRELALFHFVASTITRNGTQRMFLTAFVGLGLSLVLAKLLALFAGAGAETPFRLTASWLTIPLTLSFFVLVGMRVVFLLPAELPANWVFQVTATAAQETYLGGVRKAMLALGVMPLALGFLPVTVLWWGWAAALKHLVFFVAVSWMLVELLMFRFPKIPFTCPYMPGQANIIFVWTAYGIAFMTFAYTLAGYERELIEDSAKAAEFVVYAVIFVLALMLDRRRWLRRGLLPVFQEQSSVAYQRLNLVP
ncbi:MAG: hypothetical protein WD733_19750 [Bryobacterales bacterium]